MSPSGLVDASAGRAPGVYTAWIRRAPAVLAERTDIAGFVGLAGRGPLNLPARITSWSQFVATYGRHQPNAWLAYAVEGYFANGGDACWIVRVADPLQAGFAMASIRDSGGRIVMQVTASSQGRWGDRLRVTVEPGERGRFTLVVRELSEVRERWPALELDDLTPPTVERVVNDPATGSAWISVEVVDHSLSLSATTVALTGGSDGLATLRPEHLTGEDQAGHAPSGLAALALVDEVSILAMPDIMSHDGPPPVERRRPRIPCDQPAPDPCTSAADGPVGVIERPPRFTDEERARLQDALVAQCETLRDRFAILDPPSRRLLPNDAVAWRDGQVGSTFAAFYYPWIVVADPTQPPGAVTMMPPSGHVAGVFARSDLAIGVHKAPANETVVGARDVAWRVDDLVHGQANDASVNIIRLYSGRGIRVAGARTTSRDPAWRYVNVRRLVSMVEESLTTRLAWLVFEPNAGELWREIEREVRLFLDELWRRGMLDGANAADAYHVQCDETTSTPEEIEQGRLVCFVGIQPPLPAEFVMIRIAVTESGVQVLGEQGRQVLTTAGALRG
jgi:phage tail sheath protein FI